jgi:cytochrome P450
VEPIDVFDPVFLDDPYPTYARLRDDDPVHRESRGAWLLSRYDDVVGALRDPARFSSAPLNAGAPGFKFLIGSDPPDHTTLRRLVNKPFHPAAIAQMEPRIRAIAEELIDELMEKAEANNGEVDLVASVGFPLPVIVISDLLGIPAERREDFKRWSDAMIGGLSPDSDRSKQAVAAMEMFAYFNEVIAERRERPGEDLISLLVGGTEPLSNEELLMFCMLLLVAGNETTTNLLSNLTLVMLARDDVQDALRDPSRPTALRDAIEETLRYDAPVQSLWRRSTGTYEVNGTTVPEGSEVVVIYGSANRDPRKYERADEFVLDRFSGVAVPDHVGFGAGIHHCLGAPLARLEARVAIETLLSRTKDLRPPASGVPGQRIHNTIVRGMTSLPLDVQPA